MIIPAPDFIVWFNGWTPDTESKQKRVQVGVKGDDNEDDEVNDG